jgi:hypothetical protein
MSVGPPQGHDVRLPGINSFATQMSAKQLRSCSTRTSVFDDTPVETFASPFDLLATQLTTPVQWRKGCQGNPSWTDLQATQLHNDGCRVNPSTPAQRNYVLSAMLGIFATSPLPLSFTPLCPTTNTSAVLDASENILVNGSLLPSLLSMHQCPVENPTWSTLHSITLMTTTYPGIMLRRVLL